MATKLRKSYKMSSTSNSTPRNSKSVSGSADSRDGDGLSKALTAMNNVGIGNNSSRGLDNARKILTMAEMGKNMKGQRRANRSQRKIRNAHKKGQAI